MGQLTIRAWGTSRRKGVLVAGVYEIHDAGSFVGYAPILPLKALGYVKRVDHNRKAEEFLNTEEGQQWFKRNRTFSSGLS